MFLFLPGNVISSSFCGGFELNSRCLGSEQESVGRVGVFAGLHVLSNPLATHGVVVALSVWVGLSLWPCGCSVEGRAGGVGLSC